MKKGTIKLLIIAVFCFVVILFSAYLFGRANREKINNITHYRVLIINKQTGDTIWDQGVISINPMQLDSISIKLLESK